MSDRPCLVGVDIGGTKTSAQVVGGSRARSRIIRVPTAVGSPRRVLDGTIDVIETLLADCRGFALDGLGIGVPGQVDPKLGTVRLAGNLGIGAEALDLGPALSSHFGVPTAIENDVRATALGLYTRADEPRPSTLTYVAIGTGVAAGTVIDGRLLRGAGGIAGEIGQVMVGERAGMITTIETEAANPELVAHAARAGLERSAYLSVHAPDVMLILACAVNTIFMAYDPEALVVGGGVGTAPGFFDALMDSVQIIRDRSAIANELLDPGRMTVLAPGDPIATESALVLAAQAVASTKATIRA